MLEDGQVACVHELNRQHSRPLATRPRNSRGRGHEAIQWSCVLRTLHRNGHLLGEREGSQDHAAVTPAQAVCRVGLARQPGPSACAACPGRLASVLLQPSCWGFWKGNQEIKALHLPTVALFLMGTAALLGTVRALDLFCFSSTIEGARMWQYSSFLRDERRQARDAVGFAQSQSLEFLAQPCPRSLRARPTLRTGWRFKSTLEADQEGPCPGCPALRTTTPAVLSIESCHQESMG